MAEQAQADRKGKRARSFGGCSTCRARHVRCDEWRPACSPCRRSGLVCGGYEKSIFFDFENPAEGALRFRRPLLTEEERQCMSELLTSTVPPTSAFRILAEIDELGDHIGTVHKGPFGVFALSKDQVVPPPNEIAEDSEAVSPPEESQDLISERSPWRQELVQSILKQSDQISVPPSPEFWDMSFDAGRIQEVFDDFALPDMQQFPISPYPQRRSPSPFPLSLPTTTLSSSASLNNTLPDNAVLLLNHYSTTVINSFSPFRHSKTPWHVLFLPHAKSCLAALMLGEHLNYASLSVFYGTLAMSALSLGGRSRSQMWLEQGRLYEQHAQDCTTLMLKTAYQVPKAAKYKSILMALITMVQVSLFSGSRDQTERFLLEAEKFIRLRGLKRKKSRRVRLLHHCYAFERLLHESMYVTNANSSQRHQIRSAVESSGVVVFGQDAPSFRIFPWTDLNREMMRIKGQEEGENDLLLERPGLWPGDLYPEVYGIPETWLFLLSQVIRLGNEKDAAEAEPMASPLDLKDFTSRAKAIERCINELQNPGQISDISDDPQLQLEYRISETMLDAMQQALAIYFYRRIYDLDATMLQPKVVRIRDCVLRYEGADSGTVHGSSGFTWPALIAACEAEDPEVQLSFSDWFRNCAQRSGLRSFTETVQIIEQIWEEKRSVNGMSMTWLGLMEKNALLRPHG